MDFQKLGNLIDQWKSLLTGVLALISAAVAVYNALSGLNPLAWSVAAVVALLLAIVAVRSRRAHLSRLVDPDALKLDPGSPEHLVGRREDLDKLIKALANPLVFLLSESGCGKTALLKAGVMQASPFTQRFLPIYIDMSTLDWEDAPLRAVREGFARALPEDDPARVRLDARAGPRQYAEVFDEYYRRTQRRPLLLLDQFDDYQAEPRHRQRFLPPDTRVWRNADSIARENAFWRMLRQCLQHDRISIIVACRKDADAGLASLRFDPDVPEFDLPRLEPGLVRLIIDRLTERPADKPAVIFEPQGGWTALRDRLVDDLEARGQVLPQQLKVALGGLRTLHRLTPAAYARAGRLMGLEAASVAGAIARAVRTSGLRDDDVLRLLLPLVDRTRQPPDKGPPLPAKRLADAARVPEDAVGLALDRLEADEIVRRRELQDAALGWQLDHAYLAPPILRIERERDHWHQLLAERARAYAEVAWRDKWRALLPLMLQVRLVVARLQRRFRYGEQRAYALKSLLRILPITAVAGLIAAVVWAATEYDAARPIEGKMAEMAGRGPALTDGGAAGLADLANRSWIARWRVAGDIFNQPEQAAWFAAAPGPVVRALARLDPHRLDDLVQAYVTPQSVLQPNNNLASAVRRLAGTASLAALGDGTRETLKHSLVVGLTDPSMLVDLAGTENGLKIAVEVLSNGDSSVAKALAALRDSFAKIDISDRLNDWTQAYAAGAARLQGADPAVIKELAALRGAIGTFANPYQLGALVQAYAAVAAKLNDTDPALSKELAALRDLLGRPYAYQLGALAQAYQAVAGKLEDTDSHVTAELAALRAAIGVANPYQIGSLAQAYGAAAARLTDAEHMGQELAALRDALGQLEDPYQLLSLAQAYAAIAGKLNDADPHLAAELVALRAAISNQLSAVGQDPLAAVLKDDRPEKAKEQLVRLERTAEELFAGPQQLSSSLRDFPATEQKFKEIFGPELGTKMPLMFRALWSKLVTIYRINALALSYKAVAAKVNDLDPRTAQIRDALHDAIGKFTNPYELALFAASYANTTVRLKDTDAAGVLAALGKAIGKTENNDQLTTLALTYALVATGLTDGDPHLVEVLARLRKAIGNSTDTNQINGLAQTYLAVAAGLRSADLRLANELSGLRVAIISAKNPYQLWALPQTYAVVAAKLQEGDPHAATELAALREAIGKVADVSPHGALVQAYTAVAAKLKDPDPTAAEERAELLRAIGKSKNSGQLSAWMAAYATVAKKTRPSTAPIQDIALLLDKIPALRSADQCNALVDAILAAVGQGSPPLSWQQAGLVVTAVLLQPVSAGEPTRRLLIGFEQMLRGRPDAPANNGWSGDVWVFANWARANLPGFDPYRPKVGFLPSVAVASP
jgi:hypothetical protein